MEHINQCLETYLHCFVHACPAKWSKWLPTIEFWYNSCYHLAIGRTPFEALYGYQPRLLDIPDAPEIVPNVTTWVANRQWINQLLQHHLYHAKHRMKKQADQSHIERSFNIKDMIFLKL